MNSQGDVSEGVPHPLLVVGPVAHFLTPGAILLVPDIQDLELQIHHLQDMPWPSFAALGYYKKRELSSFQAHGNRLKCSSCKCLYEMVCVEQASSVQ